MAADETDTSFVDAIEQNDPARRVRFLNSPEEFDALDYMTDAAKGMAKMYMQALNSSYDLEEVPEHASLKKREPSLGLLQRDPETLMAMMGYASYLALEVSGLTAEQLGVVTTRAVGVAAVTDDPVIKRKYRNSMLMCSMVAHRNNDEWFMRLQATVPGMFTAEQASVIGNPSSSAWDAEDSLVLRYTQAFLDGTITDELYAELDAVWNPKILYQYGLWIGMYQTFSRFHFLNTTDAARKGPAK